MLVKYLKNIAIFAVMVRLFTISPAFSEEAATPLLSDVQALIEKAATEARKSEETMVKQQENVETLKQEVKAHLEKLKQKRGEIISLVNYLRHIKNFSPFLAALTSPSFKDIVHLNVALGYLAPKVPERFQSTLDFLMKLATTRGNFEKTQGTLTVAEAENKKQISLLKKHLAELDELLSISDHTLPIRHFDSEAQLLELMDRLTVQAMDCEKVTQLPESANKGVVSAPFKVRDGSFHYANLTNRLIQAPQDGDILLSGTNVETGGVLLIRQHNCLMLVRGMDRILHYVGEKVTQQQSIGVVFGDTQSPKAVTLTIWQCKQRSDKQS